MDNRSSPPTRQPKSCHVCRGAVQPDPTRPGWLYCTGCDWPVWMPGACHWIRTPPPARRAETKRQLATALAWSISSIAEKKGAVTIPPYSPAIP